jgi:hypothetical protein
MKYLAFVPPPPPFLFLTIIIIHVLFFRYVCFVCLVGWVVSQRGERRKERKKERKAVVA